LKGNHVAFDKISSNIEQINNNGMIQENLSTYAKEGTAENTRIAYQADIQYYQEQGGQIPASLESIIAFLESSASLRNPRSLRRIIIALSQWHIYKEYPDHTKHPIVKKVMKGIARTHGVPKKQAAAMTLNDLDKIVAYLDEPADSLEAARDRAMILLGFYGAFRRSELVSLRWEQVSFENKGIIVTLGRSKTDQEGEGQRVIIPTSTRNRCPARALLDWRQASGQYEGYIFRRFSPKGSLLDKPISADRANSIIKAIAKVAGCPRADEMSAHSLRRGFATETARMGASMASIQKHGRWKSTQTVLEYIEAGREFSDSAVNVLFK
jgi:integrase